MALYNKGQYRAALDPLSRALEEMDVPPFFESDLNNLIGICHKFLCEYRVALPFHRRVLELAEKNVGKQSRGYVIVLLNLVDLNCKMKRFRDATRNTEQAVALLEDMGLQHEELYGQALMQFGDIQIEQERWKHALVEYQRTMLVLSNHKEGKMYGILINRMAICNSKLHRYNEADKFYNEYIVLSRRRHGAWHPEYAVSLFNLADMYLRIQLPLPAIPLLEHCLAIWTNTLGPDHPDTLGAHRDFALARKGGADFRAIITGPYRRCGCCHIIKTIAEMYGECGGCDPDIR